MSILLAKLKGNLSFDEAIQARVRKIADIAGRSSSYVFTTVHHQGFSQTQLHPGMQNAKPPADREPPSK